MKREIRITEDGSKTIFIDELNECYHSHYGALQEARHVFIKNGLKSFKNYEINILELGFGTGLNVLVTVDQLLKDKIDFKINYFGVEKYPVSDEEIAELNYDELFENEELKKIYRKIHSVDWEILDEIIPNFKFKKIRADFFEIKNLEIPKIDLVYFDCFGAKVQPDLWERPLLEMVSEKMKKNGILTTYSSKGSVRRVLQELGFEVERKPGPPGKREMINAKKK